MIVRTILTIHLVSEYNLVDVFGFSPVKYPLI